MANDSITTSGPDSLKDSSEVQLRAVKKVIINSGFFVASKGKLTVRAGSGVLAKKSADGDYGGGHQQPAAIAKTEAGFAVNAFIVGKLLKISLSIPEAAPMSIMINDIGGRLIARKAMAMQGAGQSEYMINLREAIANMVYTVNVATPRHSKQIRVIMLR
jgi:hypothetical protein